MYDKTSERAFGFGALIQKIQNKIQYINIKWDGEAIKGYEHSEYVLHLFNPFELIMSGILLKNILMV